MLAFLLLLAFSPEVVGNYAYLPGYGSRFEVWSISSPSLPKVRISPGFDWWLPSYVRMTPNAGYFGGVGWVKKRRKLHFQDGNIHIVHYVRFTWREVNPAEGVYNWRLIDEKIARAVNEPGVGFVFWIDAYSSFNYTKWKWARSEEERKRVLKETCMIPEWAIKKGNIKFLSNGAVAAWEPGCGYQKYFGKFLKALGERYKNHPKLIGVDMRGLDCRYGEWCWRDGSSVLREAEERTNLNPETLLRWGSRFVNDFVEAFRGQERKLVWPNCDETFIPKRGTPYDYGPASRAIWRLALSKGCGVRDGMPTAWFRYITPGWGCEVTREGYLVFDENYLPYYNRSMMYSENSEYFARDDPRFGPSSMNGIRFFITSLRVLQLRRSWEWLPWRVMDQIIEQLEPYGGEAFVRWVEFELGKRAETSPDAWCWLREGYLRSHKSVKNFERWLWQRDVPPDGLTVPTDKIDISMLKYNYPSGKGYEFHARRTDVARGSKYIYFWVRRSFISGGPHRVILKVTYLDSPRTVWAVEYTAPEGFKRSKPVETKDTGRWMTATFEISDMVFNGAFRGGMDFRLAVLGKRDLIAKFVRLIKLKL